MSHPGERFERYRRLLGVPGGSADLETLRAIVRAQLERAPFENISKLWSVRRFGRRAMPTLERYLDGIEKYGFGGTCYTNNFHLWTLLQHLGFDVSLCGADMPGGTDVHVVILVHLEERDYLVDTGYAAPFYEPMPVDSTSDLAITFGRDHYVLRPRDAQGRSRVDHFRGGERIHGYVAKPIPRRIDHFEEVIRASYADSATFMNALALVRFFDDRTSVALYNDSLIHSATDTFTIDRLPDRDAIAHAIECHFDIRLEIVREATAGLGELRRVHPST